MNRPFVYILPSLSLFLSFSSFAMGSRHEIDNDGPNAWRCDLYYTANGQDAQCTTFGATEDEARSKLETGPCQMASIALQNAVCYQRDNH
jgi:hypothetical protein